MPPPVLFSPFLILTYPQPKLLIWTGWGGTVALALGELVSAGLSVKRVSLTRSNLPDWGRGADRLRT